ncbi:MAG: hypothetical protein ACFE0I_23265 [Elainellaceae cyanobacterium]
MNRVAERVGISLLVLIAIATASCSRPSRTAQCEQIEEANNTAQASSMNVYNSAIGQTMDVPEFEQKLAQVRATAAQDIAALEISDQKLSKLRDRLANAYQQASDISGQLVTILPSDGRLAPSLENRVQQLRLEAEEDIPPTLHELTLYCIS